MFKRIIKQYNHIISDWVFDNKLKELCNTIAKDLDIRLQIEVLSLTYYLMEEITINITKLRNQ
jgi:hypothetical protein